MSGLHATPEDDAFHVPTSDDPWWSETTWFTLMVPERRIYCYVYPWVRANQGIFGGGVMAWDDKGRYPWEALHWDYQWNFPYPELGDLRDITFPNSTHISVLEPLRTYRISYEHPNFALDVIYDAILEPHVLGGDDNDTGTFAAHLDQQGRITGRLRLGDEEMAVDCYGIRDRSWGRRVPVPGLHVGYEVGTGSTVSFVAFSNPEEEGNPIVPGAGYLWRAGVRAPLTSGTRHLERDGVWPRRVTVSAQDELGRRFQAVGECINWIAFQNLPTMMNHVSLVRWEVETDDGTVVLYGELADVWDIDRYRPFARSFSFPDPVVLRTEAPTSTS